MQLSMEIRVEASGERAKDITIALARIVRNVANAAATASTASTGAKAK